MSATKIVLALTSLFLVAHADLQLTGSNIPTPCTTGCKPIVDLTAKCQSESDIKDCVCINRGLTTSCAGCIRVNSGNTEEIDDILTTCGWPLPAWVKGSFN